MWSEICIITDLWKIIIINILQNVIKQNKIKFNLTGGLESGLTGVYGK